MSSPPGGYDFEMVDKVKDLHKCVICHLLLKYTTELPCSHVFCRKCLTRWEQQQIEQNERLQRNDPLTCSFCKKPYDRDQAHANLHVDRLITSLYAKCKEHKDGCTWQDEIGNYQAHLQKCLSVVVECRFDGCCEQFKRLEQEYHEKICQHRLVACDYCDEDKKHMSLEKHFEICPNHPIICTNSGCDTKQQRNQLAGHLEKGCQFQRVSCQYQPIGCECMFVRHEQEQHETIFSNKHMALMLQQFSNTKTELQETKCSLAEAVNQLQDTKTELTATKVEMQDIKRSLYKTEQENKQLEKFTKTIAESLQLSTKILSMFSMKSVANSKGIFGDCLPLLDDAVYKKQFPVGRRINKFPIIEYNGTKYDFKELNELIDSCNYRPFKKRMEQLLDTMNTGEIYHGKNDNEIYFKFELKKNYQEFHICFTDNVKSRQQTYAKFLQFGNDNFCLFDYDTKYYFFMQIKGWEWSDTTAYLINMKPDCEKHVLQYYWNNNIVWNNFKSNKNEVLFCLSKKLFK